MKKGTNLCTCNNCGSILIDTNPQVDAPFYDGNIMGLKELISIDDMKACPVCKTDGYLNDDIPDEVIKKFKLKIAK